MIVSNERELTQQVLSVMERTPDPRFREIMTSLIHHLHGFVRDVRLTEDEFREALGFVASVLSSLGLALSRRQTVTMKRCSWPVLSASRRWSPC